MHAWLVRDRYLAEELGRLRLPLGHGITGWIAQHQRPVAIERDAFDDPRFQTFHQITGGALRSIFVRSDFEPRQSGWSDQRAATRAAYFQSVRNSFDRHGRVLVGAEIEVVRLESAISQLSEQLNTRKAVERAKGILQRDFLRRIGHYVRMEAVGA